jgi:hypothetical protein
MIYEGDIMHRFFVWEQRNGELIPKGTVSALTSKAAFEVARDLRLARWPVIKWDGQRVMQ